LDDRDDHYMQVAVSGNFRKERTPGKDEKPEDKEKLDKEFKDKLAKHEEKAEERESASSNGFTSFPSTPSSRCSRAAGTREEEPKTEEKKEDATSSTQSRPTPPASRQSCAKDCAGDFNEVRGWGALSRVRRNRFLNKAARWTARPTYLESRAEFADFNDCLVVGRAEQIRGSKGNMR
jgi:hypothetical protein